MMSTAPVSGGARAARGALAAVLAVGSAALAHAAAGHHHPHWVVLVLSLAISLPLCTALSRVRFSRSRLAAAVLSSQGVLHGLFALFPAAAGAGSLRELGGHHGPHHQHQLVVGASAEQVAAVAPDSAMALSHLLAAAATYALLRCGELVLTALIALLRVRPVLLLLSALPASKPSRPPQSVPVGPSVVVDELWLGAGPRTVRGPPCPDELRPAPFRAFTRSVSTFEEGNHV